MLGPEGKGHQLSDPRDRDDATETEYVLEVKNELIQVGDDLYQIDYEAQPLAESHDDALQEVLAFASPDRPEQRIPTEESPPRNFDFSKKQAHLEISDTGSKRAQQTDSQPLPQAYRYQPSGDYSAFLKEHRIDWAKVDRQKKPRPKPQPVAWEGRGIKFGRHFRNKSTFHYAQNQPVL